jgi:hypothetical protein
MMKAGNDSWLLAVPLGVWVVKALAEPVRA